MDNNNLAKQRLQKTGQFCGAMKLREASILFLKGNCICRPLRWPLIVSHAGLSSVWRLETLEVLIYQEIKNEHSLGSTQCNNKEIL